MKLEHESLTIAIAQTLHETLLAFSLTPDENLELDFTNVNKVDLCAIQLLLSAKKTLQANKQTLKLTNCTNSVIAAFALCGCEDLLGCRDE